MSCGGCERAIVVVSGSGSISTLYSADGSLLASRTVTMAGYNLTLNGTQDLTYTDAGRLTLSLYSSGLDDSSTVAPRNFLYTNVSGQVLSSNISFANVIPIAAETSGTVSPALGYLTPINTSGIIATVLPPTGAIVVQNSLFQIVDSRANANTNNILINFSGVGATFYGSTSNTYVMNSNGSFASFRYLGGTIGWIVEK